MGLAHAAWAEEEDIAFGLYEGHAEEVLDLKAIEPLGPLPVELVEGFEDGEAGLLKPALHAQPMEPIPFAFGEVLKELMMGPLLASGFGGHRLMVFQAPGQSQVSQ
jgi:hypothetical protein